MPVFDDDETDPPIFFEQDPDSDDLGDGYWTKKSGARVYASGDAKEAQSLMAQGKAEVPGAQGLGGVDDELRPNTSALSDEEKAPLTASQDELDRIESGVAAEGEASEEPKPLSPEAAPEAAPAPAAAPLSQGGLPALPGARGPSRTTDTAGASESQQRSETANDSVSTTRSAQNEAAFQKQQGDIAQGYTNQQQAQDTGANSVVAAQQQRKNALMQMAADKEAVTAAAQASGEARKQQVIKKYQEVDSRKTDMNGLWKDKGALGTTLGLLGVALRSITATKFGGPNTALQSIQEQKRQNIQAQMEDRNSELRGLEKELGSIEAAQPMLEARMNDALSKRLDAMTINEKSATVLANAKTMKAQLETEKASKMAESAKAYYGTLATQQARGSAASQTVGTEQGRSRLSGAGVGGEAKGKTQGQVVDELLERDKKMEERGVPKEERAKMWEQQGLRAPGGESAPESTNREQKEKTTREEAAFSEDQGKAEAAAGTVGELGSTSSLVRDTKTGKWTVPEGASAGWKFGKMTELKAARGAAIEGLGRLQSGGVISPDEAKRFETMLGNEDSSQQEIATNLNAIEGLVNNRRKSNRRDASKAAPDSWKRKPGDSP